MRGGIAGAPPARNAAEAERDERLELSFVLTTDRPRKGRSRSARLGQDAQPGVVRRRGEAVDKALAFCVQLEVDAAADWEPRRVQAGGGDDNDGGAYTRAMFDALYAGTDHDTAAEWAAARPVEDLGGEPRRLDGPDGAYTKRQFFA